MEFSKIQQMVYETAKSKGWHDVPRTIPEYLCLFHSEISEAMEEFRKDGITGPSFFIEIADIVIRILDFCEHVEVDLESYILHKNENNKRRSYRHGNKIF